ncbi:hypothetical protein T11_5707, partial [Trichinella zimbabwensis]
MSMFVVGITAAAVTLASNHLTHLPVGQTKRYSKKQKKKIDNSTHAKHNEELQRKHRWSGHNGRAFVQLSAKNEIKKMVVDPFQ